MSFASFVPLRIFSSFTMLDGAIDPKAAAKLAKERKFPAAAICDRNGLYGAPTFAQACQGVGVQPIVGTFLAVVRPGAAVQGQDRPIDWLALFAQNEQGWMNLCHHVSRAHLDRPLELDPHVEIESLRGYTDGLICLTGGNEGALARLYADERPEEAERYCDQLQALFGDRLYIEITRTGEPEEDASEEDLITLAYARDIPLVASNPAQYAESTFHAAHDAMLCIANSTQVDAAERPRSSSERWVKPIAVMEELFSDLPEAMANTLVVAQRCAYAPPKRRPLLPSLAGDIEGEQRMLVDDSRRGLARRLLPYWPEVTEDELDAAMALKGDERVAAYEVLREKGVTEDFLDYAKRLDFETDIIISMGFPGYFLIVADFIKWAKDNGIPVGPGRGSGAGSLVAWALTITDLDPLKLGLLFERFLNPERVSMPDFDIDFCETRRGEVIRYVQRKYGHDHVAQIITFGKMKARAVLRDCGRILQMGYGRVDGLCKMVPNHPTDPWNLDEALNGRKAHGVTKDPPVAEFRREYDTDPEVKRMVDLAVQLEGLPRNSSTHAAGVVIGDRPLAQLVPLYRDPRSDMPVTQFDMKHVEDTGLVKFDFLGLKTLSVLRKATDLLERRGITIDLSTLKWDDTGVYELLKRGDTVGVFQLESEGMRRTLAAVKPTNFGDIIALVSLYRPGPMDNIPLFGRRKNGLEEIVYPHEKLEPILAETYGIFVYQEQVMQAAQVLAGYSLGGADMLRRAMGKKKKEEMDQQRAIFVKGCKENSGIDAPKANELFDLIDKFAGYGFNKSHAAAYALLAYHTAWLKAHYPHEFYAAAMCFDMHQSEKLAVFVDDARRNGIELAAPDMNRSEAEFIVEETTESHAVRYALAGLRNVGEKAMDMIVEERQANGPFADLDDVFRRAPAGSMNRRQLESLAAAGAFDSLEPNRAKVLANADTLLAEADRSSRERNSDQNSLFGGDDHAEQGLRLVECESWSRMDQMAKEREVFGFYFAAHPVEQFRAVASSNGARTYSSLMAGGAGGGRTGAVMAAMVENVQKRKTRKGKDFVMADFSDSSGNFSACCFEESQVESFVKWAKESACVLLNVELDSPSPEEPPRVTVRGARPLAEVTADARMLLKLEIDRVEAVQELALLLRPGAKGAGEVIATLKLDGGRIQKVRLGRDFALDGEFVEQLANVEGLAIGEFKAKRGPERMQRAA
ncbi:DNA polymerase III subunit alpha [Novosphingobium mangrovi (ex Huang et al. 2023)]|uniref:DNA polymerase III subunit alpha n=1 Tax=Novosphingobium mangrovi (ex Huang et al. 2023) TaxID=2976432 RepID=A0ABT2I790_9SPHN|nr:DNA polymerase III subunit alpha [Novosphingobium mangrovi (ex Huang et al. 2023)]MCT2400669.1 DNA polymerase III subunit alpha [Novosphingobium mangrovi (ex Huang et al. 2023)]